MNQGNDTELIVLNKSTDSVSVSEKMKQSVLTFIFPPEVMSSTELPWLEKKIAKVSENKSYKIKQIK